MSGVGARVPVLPATGAEGSARGRLQMVGGRRAGSPVVEGSAQHESSVSAGRVLVAGADPAGRARMLAELRSLLPPDTDFREASQTWELIAQVGDSRMVVIAGDLAETSASALLRLLARRNPALPVLAVGNDRRVRASAQCPGSAGGGYRQVVDAAHA